MYIPDYDLRELLLAKDPLCAVDAFAVQVLVVLASLLGMRMCPDCPRCAECENPCVDIFGSTAERMRGLIGRAGALVGAAEAQKADGVLHIHFQLFVQCACQVNTCRHQRDDRTQTSGRVGA